MQTDSIKAKVVGKERNTAVETIILGMGCFWGAEKRMSSIRGVIDVESGYANGEIEGRYEAIIEHEHRRKRGLTDVRNHAEVVRVSFDPQQLELEALLAHFWENHDPTQGDRQGNDVGSNYRSAIYTNSQEQLSIALLTRDRFQQALDRAGFGTITTEITPLLRYFRAEEVHQDYLEKNPWGYCGLGGTGVTYPFQEKAPPRRRLIVFGDPDCAACARFEQDILDQWQTDLPISRTKSLAVIAGISLQSPISVSPTIILLERDQELSRFVGYTGESNAFWRWLGEQLLSPEQQRIAFHQGTERPFTGDHLSEKRPGTFLDPITGAPLFRAETKFESGCGWPSFFDPIDGALTLHEDSSHGMHRIEVRSASSGIHLGHVFEDGPLPTGQRYCINGNVLNFRPDKP